MRKFAVVCLCLFGLASLMSASPVTFPAGLIPFSSVYYVTSAVSNGDRLVVGELTQDGFSQVLITMLPNPGNDQFSDASIQLAPGVFFSNVYIPTATELKGDFSAFAGRLFDPRSARPGFPLGDPFVGGIIPLSRLGSPFAFRIGPAATAAPEPSGLAFVGLGFALLAGIRRLSKHRDTSMSN